MERSVELNCSKCDGVFFRRNGNQKFCVKHYRFFAMMRGAKANGKKVPSWNELESMKGVDLVCPDCNDTMVWTRRESTTKAISLQHYRDGSMALVCFSCNSRHRDMPGDSYREMPKDHKRCPRCEEVKPVSLFYRSKDARICVSRCKKCSNELQMEWRSRNPGRHAANQRAYLKRRVYHKDRS